MSEIDVVTQIRNLPHQFMMMRSIEQLQHFFIGNTLLSKTSLRQVLSAITSWLWRN